MSCGTNRATYSVAFSVLLAESVVAKWGVRMNPGNPGNFLLSLIATFSLVSLGILAPSTRASDQSLGAVSFANSGSPAAQADFLTGLAQLHNFQYRQAAEAFQRAESRDSNFAMAYWGEALTYNHAGRQQDGLSAGRAPPA